MATLPNIASLVGDEEAPVRSHGSLPSDLDVTAPTGAGPATNLHLVALGQHRGDPPAEARGEPPPTLEPAAPAPPRPIRPNLRSTDEIVVDVPQRIGPYITGRVLARGGMSKVIESWDVERRRSVALKVMKPPAPGRRAEREAWDREIAILKAVAHPGVVPLLDCGIGEGGELYIAMPLLQGRSARQELVTLRRAGPAVLKMSTYDVLVPAFLDVCEALEHVHSKGVLHCDLKPGNIFLAREPDASSGRGLLLDWGVSVVSFTATREGRGGRPGGTPGYMAPEQITGRVGDLDQRTDVYGLGCLLYEFVAWRPAIRRGDPRRALRDALRGNIVPPHLRQRQIEVPVPISDLVMRALSVDPEDRFESPAAFGEALRELTGL